VAEDVDERSFNLMDTHDTMHQAKMEKQVSCIAAYYHEYIYILYV